MSMKDFVDAILDIGIIITLIILLSSCAATSKPAQIIEAPVYHPSWPLPYEVCKVEWKIVLDEKGWPIIGVPYPENLDLKACNKDKARYLKEMTNVLCHYRPKDDPHCVQKENSF